MTCVPGFNGDSSSEVEVMEEVEGVVQPNEEELDETALTDGALLNENGNPVEGDEFDCLSF